MPYNYFKGLYDIEETIDSLKDNAYKLEDIIDKLGDTLEDLEEYQIREKIASILALEEITGNIEEIVYPAIIDAAINSGEFDYAPYIEHLINAVRQNIYEIIDVQRGIDDNPEISIDFSVLGSVDQWAIIVENANPVSKTKGIPITANAIFRYPYEGEDYEDLASRMWAEKYYGVDREGKRVIRVRWKPKRDPKTGKFVKSDETEEVDVTEKYVGKYEATIMRRLALLPQDQAPYWYIIENGNASLMGFDNRGSPYPIVTPARITDEVEYTIQRVWHELVASYVVDAEELVSNALYKSLGIKKLGKSFKEIPEDVRDYIDDILEDVESGKEEEGFGKISWEWGSSKVTETGKRFIETADHIITQVYETGTVSSVGRDNKGRFRKLGQ